MINKKATENNEGGGETIELLITRLGLEQEGQESLSPILLKISDVARLLNVTTARAYALARVGILPTVALGRQRRVSLSALEQFIANGGKALSGE